MAINGAIGYATLVGALFRPGKRQEVYLRRRTADPAAPVIAMPVPAGPSIATDSH